MSDITEHKWGDTDIDNVSVGQESKNLFISTTRDGGVIGIAASDVIAMARHFDIPVLLGTNKIKVDLELEPCRVCGYKGASDITDRGNRCGNYQCNNLNHDNKS